MRALRPRRNRAELPLRSTSRESSSSSLADWTRELECCPRDLSFASRELRRNPHRTRIRISWFAPQNALRRHRSRRSVSRLIAYARGETRKEFLLAGFPYCQPKEPGTGFPGCPAPL